MHFHYPNQELTLDEYSVGAALGHVIDLIQNNILLPKKFKDIGGKKYGLIISKQWQVFG